MWKTVAAALLLFCANSPASLFDDTEFGNAGYVDVDLGGSQYLYDAPELVVLPDRRIVVATIPSNPAPQAPTLKVVRLQAGGGLDPLFGTNGIVNIVLAAVPVDWSYATALVPLADGGLYVLVYTMRVEPASGGGVVYYPLSYLVRLRSDGTLDPGFNGGQPLTGEGRFGEGRLILQDTGFLLVAPGEYCCALGYGIEARRFRLDGTLDPGFGVGGVLSVPASGSESVGAMALPGGGLQVFHHKPWAHGQPARNFWQRYRPDGSLDTAFGNAGQQEIPLTGSFGMTRLLPLGDGTQLGVNGGCPMRWFDAEGRVLAVYAQCTRTGSSDFKVQRYGDKWLLSGEERFGGVPPPSDGTYLHVTDQAGNVDAEFAAPQGLRWRPPDSPNASYAVVADGNAHVVIVRGSGTGIRVRRYRDLRGTDPLAQPVPALAPGILVLLGGGVLLLARRRLRAAWPGRCRDGLLAVQSGWPAAAWFRRTPVTPSGL
jgi:hypothetical protein